MSALMLSLPSRLSNLNLRETCKKNHPITEALKTKCHCWLESVDLSHCGLKDGGLSTLVLWLEECGDLKELKLAGCSITASGVDPLCRFVKYSRFYPIGQVQNGGTVGGCGLGGVCDHINGFHFHINV